MYTLETPLHHVTGVGERLAAKFTEQGLKTVRDLLLFAPLRYLDATHFMTVAEAIELPKKKLITIKAKVINVSQFRRGSKMIQTATVADETGQIKLIFFNSRYILNQLKEGVIFYFSGYYTPKYRNLIQPKCERVALEQIHTARLVPYYSSRLHVAQGTLRRILQQILHHLVEIPDVVSQVWRNTIVDHPTQALIEGEIDQQRLDLTFQQLHFPQKANQVTHARQRLALEEMLAIIDYSEAAKHYLKYQQKAIVIPTKAVQLQQLIKHLPFKLTGDQLKVLDEIDHDMNQTYPMNRLLMGDVGTGKTVVAGLVAAQVVQQGRAAVLIAPTVILAQQHYQQLKKLLPHLSIKLVTAQSKLKADDLKMPHLFIGTHALIRQLDKIKPALIVYDEQQKFGVWQRSQDLKGYHPHVLNMTATPIPRSLILTIFAHVDISLIKTQPMSKPPIKTALVTEAKREQMFSWLKKQFDNQPNTITLVVAPFIDPSYHRALENIKAVKKVFAEYRERFPHLNMSMLHGRMSQAAQTQTTTDLRLGKIQLLIATPMIEVGVDLPQANIIIIESAERFGLASLHQLRGRVGRRGQTAYCFLFSQAEQKQVIKRLRQFSHLHDGQKIAELDLKYRGSGDIFNTNQHGLANLQFAHWLDPQVIKQAQTIYQQLPKSWSSFLAPKIKVGTAQLN